MRRIKGQSTLEYIIILSAIVLALMAGRSMIKTAVNQSLSDTSTSMTNATGRLPGVSQGSSGTTAGTTGSQSGTVAVTSGF